MKSLPFKVLEDVYVRNSSIKISFVLVLVSYSRIIRWHQTGETGRRVPGTSVYCVCSFCNNIIITKYKVTKKRKIGSPGPSDHALPLPFQPLMLRVPSIPQPLPYSSPIPCPCLCQQSLYKLSSNYPI